MSAAAAPSSPFFDFEAQAKSPDTGFYASDDEAFAFKPLACKFHKFVLYECLSRFFVFGSGRDAAGARTFSLLEIHREEGKIEEGCTVSAPALADDVRYSSCRGTVVGAKNGAKWPVQLQLRGGGCDVLQLDASALVYAPLAFPRCIFVTSCTPPPTAHLSHPLHHRRHTPLLLSRPLHVRRRIEVERTGAGGRGCVSRVPEGAGRQIQVQRDV
jgi:hypothetical protein